MASWRDIPERFKVRPYRKDFEEWIASLFFIDYWTKKEILFLWANFWEIQLTGNDVTRMIGEEPNGR